MTTLPSFVELMASLGLDQATKTPDHSTSSPLSSPSSSPRLLTVTVSSPTRPRSSLSLRDPGTSRNRVARYSPYSPVLSSMRRASLSAMSPTSSEFDRTSLRAYSTSPRLPSSPRMRRRSENKLTVHVYGSTTDLAANTPISTYVRRKTPGTSPTSPTFPREGENDSPVGSPMPFSLPTLPPLFPYSANSDSFPLTPNSDAEHSSSEHDSPNDSPKPLPEILEVPLTHRPRRHTGIRISTPPRSADLSEYSRRRQIIHIA